MLRQRPHLQVFGSLPAEDLVQIKRVVHREIWRGTFPDHSWRTIKQLPGTIRSRTSKRILRVETSPYGTVRVTVGTGGETDVLIPAHYDLKKGLKGWEITRGFLDFDSSTSR